MRRQLYLKSDTCTGGDDVDVAGINVKVFAHYPGRSGRILIIGIQKSAEAILVLRLSI